MPKHCPQLRIQLQELKSLFSAYCLELEQVKISKEYESIFSTQKEIENNIKGLQESMSISLEKAREIMGTDFYGPEEVANTFGFEVKKEEIPAIPYSPEDLVKAKKLGEKLILRISHDAEGNPMTMQRMNEIMTHRFFEYNLGNKPNRSNDWYKEEDFYTKDSLKMEWRLVGGSFVPDVNSKKDKEGKYTEDSRSKNYIDQTRLLRDYLKSIDSLSKEEESQCSDDNLMSLVARMGIEWKTGRKLYGTTYDANWKIISLELSQLLINVNHRRSPAEIIYDCSVQFNNTGDEGIFKNGSDSSRTVGSGGALVFAGSGFNSFFGWGPEQQVPYAGVVSVR